MVGYYVNVKGTLNHVVSLIIILQNNGKLLTLSPMLAAKSNKL